MDRRRGKHPLRALAAHFGHFLVSEAETFSIFSKRCPHFTHLYSYNGNAGTPLTDLAAKNTNSSMLALYHAERTPKEDKCVC